MIEDAKDARELFASELELAGFVVFQAETGHEGLDKAVSFEPDIIVLDLMLPGLNGFNLARLVRAIQRDRGVVIVAVSVLTADPLRRAALDAGCDCFLSKPVVPARVVEEALVLLKRAKERPSPWK